MSDTDDPAQAAARLEEALERIAALADALSAREASAREAALLAEAAARDAVAPEKPAGGEFAAADVAAVTERLEALIARLRGALAAHPV